MDKKLLLNKKLLLKDLSRRITYHTKLLHIEWSSVFEEDIDSIEILESISEKGLVNGIIDISDIKPYLFPMSSLTFEQRGEISNSLKQIQKENPPYGAINYSGTDNVLNSISLCSNWLIEFYCKNHIDYLGLIDKGMAIDCTNLNIY
jgi:hypothetical protein